MCSILFNVLINPDKVSRKIRNRNSNDRLITSKSVKTGSNEPAGAELEINIIWYERNTG